LCRCEEYRDRAEPERLIAAFFKILFDILVVSISMNITDQQLINAEERHLNMCKENFNSKNKSVEDEIIDGEQELRSSKFPGKNSQKIKDKRNG